MEIYCLIFNPYFLVEKRNRTYPKP